MISVHLMLAFRCKWWTTERGSSPWQDINTPTPTPPPITLTLIHTHTYGRYNFLKKELGWFHPGHLCLTKAAGKARWDEKQATNRSSKTSADRMGLLRKHSENTGVREEFDIAEWINGHQPILAISPKLCVLWGELMSVDTRSEKIR